MGDVAKDDDEELVDGDDPVDDPEVERTVRPHHLGEALREAAHDAEESGEGGLIDPDALPD